jgi:hypothetical protein
MFQECGVELRIQFSGERYFKKAWFRPITYLIIVVSFLAFVITEANVFGVTLLLGIVVALAAYASEPPKPKRRKANPVTPAPDGTRTSANAPLASWCPTGTVTVSKLGIYTLLPGLNRQQLESTRRIVEQQLLIRERSLRQAERAADNANRAANTNRARKTAKHFSTRRSLQGIRHSMSEMQSTMVEFGVQKIVRDINQLDELKYKIDENLQQLEYSVQPQPRYNESTKRRSWYCTNCGDSVNPSDSYCGNCGTAVP